MSTDRFPVRAQELAALERELESLRAQHRIDLERSLRGAREYGAGSDSDDFLSALEDSAIDIARIAQLEDLVRTARIVNDDLPVDGRAGLGSEVRVLADGRKAVDYVLVGRRGPDSGPGEVSLGSPVGKALLGATAGDVVHVDLPDGRRRTLEVLDVRVSGTSCAGVAPRRAAA
jgi:transcription elongation factor GreA